MIVITFYVSEMNTLILFFLEQVNQQRTCSFGKKRSASGQPPYAFLQSGHTAATRRPGGWRPLHDRGRLDGKRIPSKRWAVDEGLGRRALRIRLLSNTRVH